MAVTQAEYARLRGISRQRVTQLKGEGRLVLTEEGLVDVAATDALLAKLLDRSRAHRPQQIQQAQAAMDSAAMAHQVSQAHAVRQPAPDEVGATAELPLQPAQPVLVSRLEPGSRPERSLNDAEDYWQHKARREAAEAQLAELKLRERNGELVRADEVRRERQRTAQQIANALLLLPAKLAPVIAPQDPLRAEQALADEIRSVLRALANDLEAAA